MGSKKKGCNERLGRALNTDEGSFVACVHFPVLLAALSKKTIQEGRRRRTTTGCIQDATGLSSVFKRLTLLLVIELNPLSVILPPLLHRRKENGRLSLMLLRKR